VSILFALLSKRDFILEQAPEIAVALFITVFDQHAARRIHAKYRFDALVVVIIEEVEFI
jgi:hypothetical protein